MEPRVEDGNDKDSEERDSKMNKESYTHSSTVGLLGGVMNIWRWMEPGTVWKDKKWVCVSEKKDS